MAAGKTIADDVGAYIYFEDETGQSLTPPKGRTWAVRGARPMVQVSGRRKGRVSVAGVVCFRPGHRFHLLFRLHIYHGRKDEPKSFAWSDYRDLITATHQQLGTPIVWLWDNLSVHLRQELFDYAEENKQWLKVFQMPAYAPELNSAEGVWSLLKRAMANFVASDLRGRLRRPRQRPHRIALRGVLDQLQQGRHQAWVLVRQGRAACSRPSHPPVRLRVGVEFGQAPADTALRPGAAPTGRGRVPACVARRARRSVARPSDADRPR